VSTKWLLINQGIANKELTMTRSMILVIKAVTFLIVCLYHGGYVN
jgi:hypothetical protein